jgi:tetratricopeptide (TPR) repeat protein
MQFALNVADATSALKTAEQSFGNQSLELIPYLDHLASSLHAQGQYGAAEECYLRALAITRTNKSEDDNVIDLEHKLGVLYRIQDKYAEAEQSYLSALSLAEKVYGERHVKVAEQNNYLAGLYYACGLLDLAERTLLKSIDYYTDLEGEHSAVIGLCSLSLALIKRKSNAEEQALNHFHQAKRLLTRSPALRGSIEAGLLILAMHHFEERKTDKAEVLLRHFLVLDEKLWTYHPLVTESFYDLAKYLQDMGQNAAAEACYLKVLHKQQESLDAHHPLLIETLKRLTTFHLLRGENEKAIPYMRQALGI